MKKKLFMLTPLLLSAVLISCEQSKKGDWTSSDMEECINDGKKELVGEDFEMMTKMFNVDGKNLPSCVCKNLEKNYESYEAADKIFSKKNNLSDEEGLKLFGDCLGEDFKNFIKESKEMQ